MNACQQIRPQLGEYLDDQLAPSERSQVQFHLDACAVCRAELKELEIPASVLGSFTAQVPSELWPAINSRLENRVGCLPQPAVVHHDSEPAVAGKLHGASPARSRPVRVRSWARLATAAAIIVAAGLGLSAFVSYDRPAAASEIDFSVLLEALPSDVDEAFARFVSHNNGQRMTPEQVRQFAPTLTFDTPAQLPGGFQLKEVYALRVGDNPGVAARYERNGEFLAAIFHPPVKREDFGSHKDYECVVGKHRGHAVSVGEWKLVHLTDPTTCHCVLSRLDEHSELPAVMRVLATGSTALQE
jgi:hypothetical protein